MTREPIYKALFDLLKGTEGLMTSSRLLKHWADVPHADQPALFMSQRGEQATPQLNIPTIWKLNVDIVLYALNHGEASQAPMQQLNPIIDAIVAKLLPTNGVTEQTLGGLVTKCRIDGEILTDEGVLGDQAVVVIPVSIVVPQ